MKNAYVAALCCITLLAVIIDLSLRGTRIVHAQGGRTVYADYVEVQPRSGGASKIHGTTVVGFSCAASPTFVACYVASE